MDDDDVSPVETSDQTRFIEMLNDEFKPQPRFRSLWLTGSFGTATQDRFSDVDTLLVVADHAFDEVLSSWPEIASLLIPLVYMKRLAQAPVFNHVLPGWLRWDVTLVRSTELPQLIRGRVRAVFDKDDAQLADPPPPRLNTEAAVATVEEFLRVLGLLPVVVGRQDGVSVATGAGLLRQHLIGLMRIRSESGNPHGALRLRQTLDSEDYAALQALPALTADVDDGIRLHRAVTDLFIPLARETLGQAHPTPLEASCLHRLDETLGSGWGQA